MYGKTIANRICNFQASSISLNLNLNLNLSLNLKLYIILFLFPLMGGLLSLAIKSFEPRNLKLVLSFSGAFLFCITVLEIIPGVYSSQVEHIGIYVLIGFFLQIILEQFTEGVEHGHLHFHHHQKHVLPWVLIISLALHSFFEGLPLGDKSVLTDDVKQSLMYGIALHEAPAAFALMSVLKYAQLGRAINLIVLVFYSAMSLAGLFLSNYLGNIPVFTEYHIFEKLMALVVGTFLHISTTILFESGDNHRFGLYKLIAIVLGIALALSTII